MAKRTSEERSQNTLDKAAMIRDKDGDVDLPERYTQDGIAERREHVWKFMARRVPQTVMAELLGVSRRTIYEDVQWWKRRCQEHMERVKEDPEAARLLLEMFEKCFEYLQMKYVGRIAVPGVGEKGGVLQKPEALEEARTLGAELARLLPDR